MIMIKLDERSVDRIIEMAWEDRTPFEAIKFQFGISEKEVIDLMCRSLELTSWRRWRRRVQGRKTKHLQKRNFTAGIFKCSRQKSISNNQVCKRKK